MIESFSTSQIVGISLQSQISQIFLKIWPRYSLKKLNWFVLGVMPENFRHRYEFYFVVTGDHFEYFLDRLTNIHEFPTRRYFSFSLNVIFSLLKSLILFIIWEWWPCREDWGERGRAGRGGRGTGSTIATKMKRTYDSWNNTC